MKTWTLAELTEESSRKKEAIAHRINGMTTALYNVITNQFTKKALPRNYILDGTNLSDEGRRQKLENFEGYGTKIAACFVVPGSLLDSRSKAVKRTIAGVTLDNLGATYGQKGRFDLPEEVDAKIVELPALDLPEPVPPPEEPKKEEIKEENKEEEQNKEQNKEENKEQQNQEEPSKEEPKVDSENVTKEEEQAPKEENSTEEPVKEEETAKKENENVDSTVTESVKEETKDGPKDEEMSVTNEGEKKRRNQRS